MLKRVLIMAGGTGGHVFPALAVADALKQQGVEVTWLGTENGLEADVVSKAGFIIDWISIRGLRGNGVAGWLLAPVKLSIACYQARKIIKLRNPDIVIGMGGFVTGPGGFVAWLSGKPLLIHEQNAVPGLTNRLLSVLAKRVLEAFPGAFANKNGVKAIGNPVRESLINQLEPAIRMKKNSAGSLPLKLLVVGGSLGARAINLVLPETLTLLTQNKPIDVWHQTGKKLLGETEAAYHEQSLNAKVVPFIDDIAEAYAWADLVLCRSGALTVSELAAIGVASILVPFPHAVDDHQTKNADFLVQAGAAILLPQSELTAQFLSKKLDELMHDREKILTMAQAAYDCRQIDAVEQVIVNCQELVNV